MNALRSAHADQRGTNRSENRHAIFINIGFGWIYERHLVRTTSDVIDVAHRRSHLHDIRRTSCVWNDVGPIQFFDEIFCDSRTLSSCVLGKLS